jgi:Holliday junction DNA helicase RuvA
MNILALGSVAEIESAVARGDATYLSAVQGIGKKTAERMVVELKTKVRVQGVDTSNHANSEALGEVLDVLVGMGYGRDEVRETLKHIEGDDTEVLLRNALKVLSK